MAHGDFDAYYPASVWDSEPATFQRQWYDPVLRDLYQRETIYQRFVTVQFSTLGRPTTAPIVLSSLILPHPNFNPVGARVQWMPSSYVDTQDRTINTARYAGKMSYHEADDMIIYFRKDGVRGLAKIINQGIGHMMNETMDALSRNAYLLGAMTSGYCLYGNGGASFADIATQDDNMKTEVLEDIHLGMLERGVPYADTTNPDSRGTILCVTSPGVIRDLRAETDTNKFADKFIPIAAYARPMLLYTGEIGQYRGVRFLQTPRAVLYNCGEVAVQSAIGSPLAAGSGAPAYADARVDGVWRVGQDTGVTHYVQLAAATSAGDMDLWAAKVNQIITIHLERTSAYGIANGVKINDGLAQNRRLISVDKTNKRLVLDKPVMEDYITDLGSGVYGYVTSGKHIHSSLFLGGNDGIVMGVHVPPRLHLPRPVDDFDSMVRVSWDMYAGYNLWEPQTYEVVFSAGSTRFKGPRVSYPAA